MSSRTGSDFILETRKRNVGNHVPYSFIGHSDVMDATEGTVWFLHAAEGDPVLPTSAQTVTLSSSSTSDNIAGTGIGVVKVDYLDSSLNPVEELVTLSGQTGVALSQTCLRVNRIIGVFAGSGQTNAGIIYAGYGTVTTGKPANIMCAVDIGEGISRVAQFTVPNKSVCIITSTSISSASNKAVEIELGVMANGTNCWLKTTNWHLLNAPIPSSPGNTSAFIPSKADFRYLAETVTGSFNISVQCSLLLVAEDQVNQSVGALSGAAANPGNYDGV